MDFFCGLSEISETKGMKSGEISKKASEKFDRLMGDHNLSEVSAEQQEDIIPEEPDYSEKREQTLFMSLMEIHMRLTKTVRHIRKTAKFFPILNIRQMEMYIKRMATEIKYRVTQILNIRRRVLGI